MMNQDETHTAAFAANVEGPASSQHSLQNSNQTSSVLFHTTTDHVTVATMLPSQGPGPGPGQQRSVLLLSPKVNAAGDQRKGVGKSPIGILNAGSLIHPPNCERRSSVPGNTVDVSNPSAPETDQVSHSRKCSLNSLYPSLAHISELELGPQQQGKDSMPASPIIPPPSRGHRPTHSGDGSAMQLPRLIPPLADIPPFHAALTGAASFPVSLHNHSSHLSGPTSFSNNHVKKESGPESRQTTSPNVAFCLPSELPSSGHRRTSSGQGNGLSVTPNVVERTSSVPINQLRHMSLSGTSLSNSGLGHFRTGSAGLTNTFLTQPLLPSGGLHPLPAKSRSDLNVGSSDETPNPTTKFYPYVVSAYHRRTDSQASAGVPSIYRHKRQASAGGGSAGSGGVGGRGLSPAASMGLHTVVNKMLIWKQQMFRPNGSGVGFTLDSFGMSSDASAHINSHGQKARKVVPNHMFPESPLNLASHPNHEFAVNRVRTTKYTVVSFLPKNLFEQFHRFANLYFLFIVLLNWVPQINAFGKEIAMLPVLFVLGVTAIKDIFEDRRRYRSDKRINNSTCRVFNREAGRYVKTLWKDVLVGDIVHLSCNEVIPADILLLHSSDDMGLCYIETSNLDGESNLKQRMVVRDLVDEETFHPTQFGSTIECDLPNNKIYRFHGSIVHPDGERVPIDKDNLLLRDCVVKNTDYVEGIVVYAGHETKAMLNNGGPRYKRSKLERRMNWDVMCCVIILVILCFIGAVGSGMWLSSYTTQHHVPFLVYIDPTQINPAYEGFLSFWTHVIILQVMIPLSLYVSIEIIKLGQIFLIHNDIELYDPSTDKRVECRALNIPEELGQVQYIFSDKTGTLTENHMIFRRCTIGGVDYNHHQPSISEWSDKGEKDKTKEDTIILNARLQKELLQIDTQIIIDTSEEGPGVRQPLSLHFQRIQEFFLLLAVCNTVVVSKHPHQDKMNSSGLYLDSSNNPTLCHDNISNSVKDSDGSDSWKAHASLQSEETDHYATVPTSLTDADWREKKNEKDESAPEIIRNRPFQRSSYRRRGSIGFAPIVQATISANCTHLSPYYNTTQPGEGGSLHLLQPLTTRTSIRSPKPSPRARFRLPINKMKGFGLGLGISLGLPLGSSPSNTLNTASTPSPSGMFRPIYEAESPDELALVNAAYQYNCRLLKRLTDSVTLALPGEGLIEFKVLHVLPFDPTRKRMSVILQHPATQEKILYCKGADSSMFTQLSRPKDEETSEMIVQTQQHLNNYARRGLRVLVMAKKVLSAEEYREWSAAHHQAEVTLDDRDQRLFESACRIERNMELLGATGIEDRLQEGVPETIATLRKAGIVLWLLTGDKQETAVNIAYSCCLFAQEMEIITLNARSREAAETTIKFHLDQINKDIVTVRPTERPTTPFLFGLPDPLEPDPLDQGRKRGLVIDGRTLAYVLEPGLDTTFLELAHHCHAVLCCRATPLQKAAVVRLVKEELRVLTLAIGDGANDVSMIQTADVGIGISGEEGMQAVMASDFCMAKFKYLERLLLVHGHWNYDRLARTILYFFYKNAGLIFVIFWFELYNGFSGMVIIEQLNVMLYNLIFTSLPPLVVGIYDQDAPAELLLARPELYRQGRRSEIYKHHSFWVNMADALYQSIVIFFVAHFAYHNSEVGIFEFGMTVTTALLCVQQITLGIETKSWTSLHLLSHLLSFVIYFGFNIIYQSICVACFNLPSPYWTIFHCFGSAKYWLTVLVISVLGPLPRFLVTALQNTFTPMEITRVLQRRELTRINNQSLNDTATTKLNNSGTSDTNQTEENLPNASQSGVAWSKQPSGSSVLKIQGGNFKNTTSEILTEVA